LQRNFIVRPEQLAEAETRVKVIPAPVLMSGFSMKGPFDRTTPSTEAATA